MSAAQKVLDLELVAALRLPGDRGNAVATAAAQQVWRFQYFAAQGWWRIPVSSRRPGATTLCSMTELSPQQARVAIKRLVELECLEVRTRGIPCTSEFRFSPSRCEALRHAKRARGARADAPQNSADRPQTPAGIQFVVNDPGAAAPRKEPAPGAANSGFRNSKLRKGIGEQQTTNPAATRTHARIREAPAGHPRPASPPPGDEANPENPAEPPAALQPPANPHAPLDAAAIRAEHERSERMRTGRYPQADARLYLAWAAALLSYAELREALRRAETRRADEPQPRLPIYANFLRCFVLDVIDERGGDRRRRSDEAARALADAAAARALAETRERYLMTQPHAMQSATPEQQLASRAKRAQFKRELAGLQARYPTPAKSTRGLP